MWRAGRSGCLRGRGECAKDPPLTETEIKQRTHRAEKIGSKEEKHKEPHGFLVAFEIEKHPDVDEGEGDRKIPEELGLDDILEGRKHGPKTSLGEVPCVEGRESDKKERCKET